MDVSPTTPPPPLDVLMEGDPVWVYLTNQNDGKPFEAVFIHKGDPEYDDAKGWNPWPAIKVGDKVRRFEPSAVYTTEYEAWVAYATHWWKAIGEHQKAKREIQSAINKCWHALGQCPNEYVHFEGSKRAGGYP